MDEEEKAVLDWSRANTSLARDLERAVKDEFDCVVRNLDRHMMATRHRRESNHMFYNATSSSTVNQSNSNLLSVYSSRSTLADHTSIASQSDVTSAESKRPTSRFAERLKKATKQPPAETTNNKNTPKVVFIPSGFERDILEFHKYNDF